MPLCWAIVGLMLGLFLRQPKPNPRPVCSMDTAACVIFCRNL